MELHGFLFPQIHDLLNQYYTGQKVFICGHSVGGCYALLAAQVMASLNFDVSAIYTFGSPAVGDTVWKYAAHLFLF